MSYYLFPTLQQLSIRYYLQISKQILKPIQLQKLQNKVSMLKQINQWKKGPIQSIACTPAHGQPVFSLAVGSRTFVTGSADHGLRQYQIESGKYVRQLFGKKYGHKQWVTTCYYTPSGRVISGGMDSVVCFWESKAVKCEHFLGHQGSISKVMGNDSLGISSSYDATMLLWDLSKKQQCQKLIGPHKQAIMDFEWQNSLLISGDKSGVIGIWDLNECKLVKAVKTHKGSVSSIKIDQQTGIFVATGLNDGSIAGFDMRSNTPIHRQMIHKGSVNSLKLLSDRSLALTCSADGNINIISLPDFSVVKTISTGDMLFSVEQCNGVILAGSAKGNVLAYDFQGKSLYGYGVMKKGGCRLLAINKQKNRLICAGEDESATILAY